MGAHRLERDGVAGVMFCLWAPNARSVSVLGNFNGWDGRLYPMQSRLGGCWELFIPGLQAGEMYKYEIRTQQGHCYQKSDPYGFRHEVRPNHGSIVEALGAPVDPEPHPAAPVVARPAHLHLDVACPIQGHGLLAMVEVAVVDVGNVGL